MSFISYAQNFEDVMLWRALKHIKNGFYIDIGANDPVIHSVTKSMYDMGWNGINCEPVSHWFMKLEEERPNDINLQVAIGAENTELTFYEVINTGLSTLDKEIATKHAKNLGFKVKEYPVQVQTLTSICNKKNIHTIHFLKIDVEGAEKSVLEGIDFKKIRPWIIVVEATKPMSEDIDFEDWEDLILLENYHFIYFDGLNRFYIADEQSQLDIYFKTPPNVFDDFILPTKIDLDNKIKEVNYWWEKANKAEEKANKAEARANQAEVKANQAEAKANQAEAKANQAEVKANQAEVKANQAEARANETLHHYHMIQNSTSWKITKPYRYAGDKSKWFYANAKNWITFSYGSRPRRVSKKILLNVKYRLNSHPKLKYKIVKILNKFPTLKYKLKQINNKPYITPKASMQEDELSERGNEIYQNLKNNISKAH